jgi:hypothetical protein
VHTTGNVFRFVARTTSSSQPKSRSRTSRSKNNNADKARFCVDAATWPSTAKCVKNSVTSFAPISSGCRTW